MRNRWGQDIKRGQTVRVHLPRGGFEVGEIIKVTREAGGSYLTLESGRTASIDDVHQIVAEHPVTRRKSNPLTRVKVNSPSMRTKEAPSARLKTRRKKTARAPEGYYANPQLRKVAGSFDAYGKRRFFGPTTNQWAIDHGFPYELESVSIHGNAPLRVTKTRAYVVVDEDENGKPVVETWPIRNLLHSEPLSNPLSRVKVNSPSMLTKEPPSARLKARRRKTAKAPAGVYANPAPVTVSFGQGLIDTAGPDAMRDFGDWYFLQWKNEGDRVWTTHRMYETLKEAESAARAMHRNHPDSYIRVVKRHPKYGDK